jgi:large subunit ribosomal protein L25
MAELSVIPAKIRRETGSAAVRRLRASGEIPAIIYGHKQDPVPLTVSTETIESLIRHGARGLLEIDVAGQKESAVIKEMQWDALGREILHVDFARVSRTEKVTVAVPVELHGIAPGAADGIVDHQLHTIELECSAADILEHVTVNINHLELNQAILVKDLEIPSNIKVLADPEQVVVQVIEAPAEVEETEAAGPSEPELIRREEEDESEG